MVRGTIRVPSRLVIMRRPDRESPRVGWRLRHRSLWRRSPGPRYHPSRGSAGARSGWIAERANGSLGKNINIDNGQEELLARVGAVGFEDLHWMVSNLQSKQLFTCGDHFPQGTLTIDGWNRVEELKRPHISSKYAFFARQFTNPDLDMVFEDCLRPAVEATGY